LVIIRAIISSMVQVANLPYDQANRMISTTLSGATTLFNYNGDGVRLKQVVAGVPTTYTQDLAAPLPIVLQAKTGTTANQYLYSMGTRPVAQYVSSAWQYLLPDALGSVRQIVDASGNVLLTESYEPYGKLLSSSGSATSIFAYAGEQADSSGLIYLRARYMNPTLGIFTSRDPWSGDQLRPGSMNGWGYVEGNPVNRVDPSGMCAYGDTACQAIARYIETAFQVSIDLGSVNRDDYCDAYARRPGTTISWETEELLTVGKALGLTRDFLGGEFYQTIGNQRYTISRVHVNDVGSGATRTIGQFSISGYYRSQTLATDDLFAQNPARENQEIGILMHEFFHVYDYSRGLVSSGYVFATPLSLKPDDPVLMTCGPSRYACTDQFENFADSAAVYALGWLANHGIGEAGEVLQVYGDYAAPGQIVKPVDKWTDFYLLYPYGPNPESSRRKILNALFSHLY
jgi:RHS repeat-associated protein